MQGEPKGLAWSRGGAHLLVASDAGEGGGLWRVALDGRAGQLATAADASGVASHDDRIAYVRGSQIVDIWRVDLGTPQSERKLIFSTRVQMLPQFSPDATRIAFQSNRSGSFEIWMADADGANPVRLTAFDGPLTGAPVWCRDGRRIAFDSRATGTSAIYVMDVEERLPRRVATTRENIALPAWSEDCRWLFASNGRQALYRIPSSGGPAELFTQQRSYYAAVAGDRVIFNVAQPTGVQLWSKSVAGGEEAPLAGMPRLAYADSWIAARTGIYYVTSMDGTAANGSPTLSFYDFETGKARDLMSLQQAPTALGGLGISVSSDGRSLLYTSTGDVQSDIMLLSRYIE
jgi:Tol biopolymer transport system component